MAFILRVDVDKPYGHSTIINKIKSKLAEDYWFPKRGLLNHNYLYHLREFIEVCNKESIPGYFYFRICTVPDIKIKNLLSVGNHQVGMHAENTKDFYTFEKELNKLTRLSGINMKSFTKHGSGSLKLGRYHYPAYEPDKYLAWSEKANIEFYFGNGICSQSDDFHVKDKYYPKMFWIERDYRNDNFFALSDLIHCAKTEIVPILIHPCNFASFQTVRDDFMELIHLSKQNNIDWILL